MRFFYYDRKAQIGALTAEVLTEAGLLGFVSSLALGGERTLVLVESSKILPMSISVDASLSSILLDSLIGFKGVASLPAARFMMDPKFRSLFFRGFEACTLA